MKDLEAAGVELRQAEALVRLVQTAQTAGLADLVTKAELAEAVHLLERRMDQIERRIDQVEHNLTLRLGGLMAAGIAVLAALMALL